MHSNFDVLIYFSTGKPLLMINWCSKTVMLCEFVLIGVPNTC